MRTGSTPSDINRFQCHTGKFLIVPGASPYASAYVCVEEGEKKEWKEEVSTGVEQNVVGRGYKARLEVNLASLKEKKGEKFIDNTVFRFDMPHTVKGLQMEDKLLKKTKSVTQLLIKIIGGKFCTNQSI